MTNESPAVILYDGNGNPVGTVVDGIYYRLQVEAKLATGSNVIGRVGLETGSNTIGNVGLTAGNTVGLAAGASVIGNVGLETGVNTIGNVGLTAGNTVGLAAGASVIGNVGLETGVNTIGTVGLTPGSTISLDTGVNSIGTVGLTPGSTISLDTGANTIGTVSLTDGSSILIKGRAFNNSIVEIKSTNDGYLVTTLIDNRLPFGALFTEGLTPVVQGTPIYGIIPEFHKTTISLSGTVIAESDLFTCSTGITSLASATLQSKERIKYRPGQGMITKFSALYPASVANSILIAGIGHAESGCYFGYNGTIFGILYVNGGVREIRTLTITTKSSTAETITITLDGIDYTVAVTNGTNINKTAYEISLGTFGPWSAVSRSADVVFLNNSAGIKSGVYAITGTTVVGTFAQTTAGVSSTDTWIPQSEWNCDKLDGTGNSGIILDPSKGNNYTISIQYLGFGAITFGVESHVNNNHNDYINVHTLQRNNNVSVPILNNSSYPFTMVAYSAGSTDNLSVSSGGYSMFLSGIKKVASHRITYFGSTTAANATDYTCIFTIRNETTYNNRASQVIMDILSVAAAAKHTQPVVIFILKNATLFGPTNFTRYSTSSPAYFDNTSTTCTITDNSQILLSLQLAETADIAFNLSQEINIQVDDTITMAVKSITGTPAYVLGSVNIREDH